ncbi:MAG: SDR family oxidoreductase [Candidatus Kapaibacterium sp.]
MKKQFENKVVIVTGASMGIGKAVALAFSSEGAKVAVVDIDEREGKRTVEAIKEGGGEAVFIPCDVSNPEQVKNMVRTTVAEYGRLDYACNNAGIEGEQQQSTVECSLENWENVINVNLKGVWLCMKHEIPEMLRAGGGAIVNVSSIAGLVGFPNIPAYVASKHGVVGLTKTTALECAKQNIRVNTVCPGGIDTPMLERFTKGNDTALQQMNQMHPMGRVGTSEEIASAVLWLCSDAASFTTGQSIAVDGGYIAQ